VTDGSAGTGVIRRLVDTLWSQSDHLVPADPDGRGVRAFAEFGLPPWSPFATKEQLDDLEAWRNNLQIPPNSAFLDGTLLMTVEALLGPGGPEVLTPVTLWELTTFIDALVCFDRLYCIANPIVDVSHFNRRLGADVITVIPDPDGGMLRRLAAQAAGEGLEQMRDLSFFSRDRDARLPLSREEYYAWGQELLTVVDGWRAVLGPDVPRDGPFDISKVDIGLAQMEGPASAGEPGDPYFPGSDRSSVLVDGPAAAGDLGYPQLEVLVKATRLPRTPAIATDRPSLEARKRFAASSTYRTYVNQGIANALKLPYQPGTLRMPFRRLFIERSREIQDELVTVALADKIFASLQPSSPLTLPFFTASVLKGATTREDVWAHMARKHEDSLPFRRHRAERDLMLESSSVSPEALRVQSAIRDEALKLADLAGVAQQSASVAAGVVAQTSIVPLAGAAGALEIGLHAARGLGRDGSWTRVWRRLFHRHEYFLAQTNSQAIELTNALPQIQQLWQMPKIGAYLDHFASATRQMGHVLRD
jgi:hypothetical protein